MAIKPSIRFPLRIDVVTAETASAFPGDSLSEHFRIRYQNYKDLGWDGIVLDADNQHERDQFDDEHTYYLLCRDVQNLTLGVLRAYPASRPHMSMLFNDIVTRGEPLSARNYRLDGSRMGINFDLVDKELRQDHVIPHLVLGHMELGLALGAQDYVGLMPHRVWQSTFIRNGWPVEFLGEEAEFKDGSVGQVGRYVVSRENEESIRKTTGIAEQILNLNGTRLKPLPILCEL